MTPSTRSMVILAAALLLPFTSIGQTNGVGFFNWETSPVHPAALSPDGTTLAVCNLPDGRLELFDVRSGKPSLLGSVPVGLDPVTARFHGTNEIWVANFISDSISVVDTPSQRVKATLTTADEPADIVFAGNPQRAYISCARPGLVQVVDPVSMLVVTNISIAGNRPRSMDTSPDGSKIYVAIFESGNASTIIGAGVAVELPRPTPIEYTNSPSGGLDPPPNRGQAFVPPINPSTANIPPPRTGLIVKKDKSNHWLDDNLGDWTEFISGEKAAFTGRVPGWDVPDHDIAVVDTSTFSTTYATGLMNICMSLAVNPGTGTISVVGTDAINQVRFEPNLKGIFVRVELAEVDPNALTSEISDLNPHLTYQTTQVSDDERLQSIGDPRGIVWNSDGSRGYVAGMGSDNVIVIDSTGKRSGPAPSINVGQGPAGMALDESRQRLYVYNRFSDSISTIDTAAEQVIDTLPLFDPTPQSIKTGRPHLYNTHQTSGLGQAACASCHVDARFDRLAWDLGDPTAEMAAITTNRHFVITPPGRTNYFHPMKGPMVTQTLQDIIGHEPFHWRGDRDGLEAFNGTFTNLQAAASSLAADQMQELKDFLATVRFSPNPYRQIDNSLPPKLALPGQLSLGRGILTEGAQLPDGSPINGMDLLFRSTNAHRLTFNCIACHTLPTGLGPDRVFQHSQWIAIPSGSNAAHHIALAELDRSSGLPFKVPQLRNLGEKLGMNLASTASQSGFGFGHDGSVDSLTRFVHDGFAIVNDQATADLVAFLLCLRGSDLPAGSLTDPLRAPGVASLDTPAGVGRQITLTNSFIPPLLTQMLGLAGSASSRVDLIAKGFKQGLARGWVFDRSSGGFLSDRRAERIGSSGLVGLAKAGAELTFTLVPGGSGVRLGIDRDGDGYLDRDELDYGSDPADPRSLATNTPPQLSAPTRVTVLNGATLRLSLSATDSDIPSQTLTFSLSSNAPPGALIDPSTGLLTWIAAGSGILSTNWITVSVSDNGKPNKTDSQTIAIVIVDFRIQSIHATDSGLAMSWPAEPGASYRLQYKDDLANPDWTDVVGQQTAAEGVVTQVDSAAAGQAARFYRVVIDLP